MSNTKKHLSRNRNRWLSQSTALWCILTLGVAVFLSAVFVKSTGNIDVLIYFAAMILTAGGIFGVMHLLVGKHFESAPANAAENETNVETSHEQLVTLAYTDSLTKLGNRERMVEKFNTLIQNCHGSSNGFLIGIVDMNGMKPINSLYGYECGNTIIKQCAQRLSAAVEGVGYVFRYRGDEFGFLFPNVTDEENANQSGKILQDVLQASFDLNGITIRLSGSFGFALCPRTGNSFEEIIKKIESTLYYSKRIGRGRVTLYSQEIENTIIENARMEQALRAAIENNLVQPHFQPIISLQNGKLIGFESLARWVDPELGNVSPAKFVPLAEERGIISALTEKLLKNSAQIAANWPEDIFLSFNLSSTQLVDPNTANMIINTIRKAGLPPNRLDIEVTETAMMVNGEIASTIIEQLKNAGMRISMDDFGTGQSSLGRLKELKLDKVKIDRAFIKTIGEDKSAGHIVRAILEMCAGLELMVVAEGIEKIHQAESLKQYGCHAGQGYLFGKPQDEHKTMEYIQEFLRTMDDEPVEKKQQVAVR